MDAKIVTAPTELLPCPFCGQQPKVFPADAGAEGNAWTAIECANCVTSPPNTQSVARVTHYAESGHFERAVAAWNTRHPVSAAEGDLLGRCVEALRKVSAVRSTNWNDGDDPEMVEAYNAVDDILSQVREVRG